MGERAGLEIDEEAALVRGGLAGGGFDACDARGVHGDRLGQPDVQAGLGGGLRLLGMEIRRREHGDDVDAARFDQFLEAVESGEAAVRGHLEFLALAVHRFLEVIRERDDLEAAVLERHLADVVRASAAADDADAQLAAGGVLCAGDAGHGDRRGGEPGLGEEVAAIGGVVRGE